MQKKSTNKIVITGNPFRPGKFSEYIGQENVKSNIKCMVTSAIKRGAPIGHILLSSAGAGLGKSTMSRIIANESKRDLIETTASSFEKPSDVHALFKRANKFFMPIIFIDEVHNIKHSLAELIYSPMEDYGGTISLSDNIGDGRQGKLEVYPFTVIAATDGRQGRLPKPFIDRFEYKPTLKMYNIEEIKKIVANSSKKLEVNISVGAQEEVAKRACFTPRIANGLLKRLRDYGVANNKRTIEKSMSIKIFEGLGLDELGLDEICRDILKVLYDSRKRRLGINSISQHVRMEVKTIQRLYEPQLLNYNLIAYLPNGRGITEEGEAHIEKNYET